LRSTRWLDRSAWLSRAFFAFAVLAKTSALPLPAVLWLGDVLLRRRSPRTALRQQAPSLALAMAIAAGVIAIWARNEMIRGGIDAAGIAPASARLAHTLAHQLATALWPSATSPMYATHAAPAVPLDWLALAAVLLASFWAQRAGARRALFALGAFVLWLAPVSNAVPMYFPLQDRYLSLPLIGVAFGFGALLDDWRTRAGGDTRLPLLIGALIVGALGLRCVQYQGEWQGQTRLWGHAASTQPDAYYAFVKLGEVRLEADDLYGAIRAYKQLLRIDPRRKLGHAALLRAVALRDERVRDLRPSRAEALSREYYAQLDDAEALRALAGRMLRSGHLRALELPMHRALELQPVADSALERAAVTHFAQGRATVGLFYLEHMQQPTQRQDLRALAARARASVATSPL
jgi:tetratricopeptide (TPR) repeat protein